jgi:hypothetical protein
MITVTGYSKNSMIIPEGIVVTHGMSMVNEQGGLKTFLKGWLEVMNTEGSYWMHKCKNSPKYEIDHVYIIISNRLYGRCYFGGFQRNVIVHGHSADGKPKTADWPFIILSGPFEKCPFKRTLKGFQGFRYCTKLF